MIYSVILSGGAGLRLWPLSQKHHPKQFIKMYNNLSSFQHTIMRNKTNLIINANMRYASIIKQQMSEVQLGPVLTLLEKQQLGTALSIAMTALNIDGEDIMVVSPSDLYIADVFAYQKIIDTAVQTLETCDRNFVLLAVRASEYNPEYGYMKLFPTLQDYYHVHQFVEKPIDVINNQSYFWHSGIFLCRAKDYLVQLKQSALNLYYNAVELLKRSCKNSHGDYCIAKPISYAGGPSVDRVILERLDDQAIAFVLGCAWHDLGNWPSLYRRTYKSMTVLQMYKGVLSEHLVMQEVIRNKLILLIVRDVIFFIFYKSLMSDKMDYVERVWGEYKVLYSTDNILIKHLIINGNKKTSLQKHQHREEYWLILAGRGQAILCDKHRLLAKHSTLYIPVNSVHQVQSTSNQKLHAIEIQRGDILSEDDIIRL